MSYLLLTKEKPKADTLSCIFAKLVDKYNKEIGLRSCEIKKSKCDKMLIYQKQLDNLSYLLNLC